MKVHQLWLLALFVLGVSLSKGSKLPLLTDDDDSPQPEYDEGSSEDSARLLNFHLPKSNKRISRVKCEGYSRSATKGLSIKERLDLCKISNNTSPRISEFPHMAAIGWQKKDKTFEYLWAGSLISELWILTSIPTSNYRVFRKPTHVLLGTNDLNNSVNGKLIKISSVARHPKNNPSMMLVDIALVKLARSVEFSINLMPACLSVGSIKAPNEFYVTSWESFKPKSGKKNYRLRKDELRAIEQSDCNGAYNGTIAVREEMICAGDYKNGWQLKSCKEDFGGPLQQRRACLFDVVGLTNFKGSCGDIKYPGVFTRVSHYIDWIEGIVWPGEINKNN